MSTYNGEVYLEEQVRSIMNQTNEVNNLLIRDDGSTDSTLKILHDLKKEFGCISIIEGENVGWRKSFFELLQCSGEFDYYAFADQDDVWYENKVESAVAELDMLNHNEPNLFQCVSTWVDSNLNRLMEQPIVNKPQTYYDAILNSWGQGAQLIFNRKLRDMACVREPIPPCAHDVWVYDIAYLFGTVLISQEALMMYRRHEESVTTVRNNSLCERIRAYRKIGRFGNYARELVFAFKNEMQSKDERMLQQLELLADYKGSIGKKMKLLVNPNIKKKTFLGTVNLKCEILCSIF